MTKLEQITETIKTKEVVDIETATKPKMNKTNNPYYGRVEKHTAYLSVDFGKNYTDEVNRRRAEEGKSTDFQAQKSLYESVNEYFVKRGEQVYLRFMFSKDTETKSIYTIDGRPATDAEVEQIKAFMPNKGKHTNQGLERQVDIRIVKIENIVSLGGLDWACEV